MADFSEFTGPSAEWLALEASLPPQPVLPVEELQRAVNGVRENAAAQAMINEDLVSRVQIQDHSIIARDGNTLAARIYRPASLPLSHPLPIYIHFHGGGFLFGTLSSEDASCSRLVTRLTERGTPIIVFNVNYRHTPEWRFPTAWNDTEDAFIWVHKNIAQIGGLSDQVFVGGISAGAQLAASLCLANSSDGANEALAACPKIQGQVLMIPWLVQLEHYAPRQEMLRTPEVSSLVQCAEAPVIPIERIKLFVSLLGSDEVHTAGNDRRLNPGNATEKEVAKLPPTTFGIAGYDPLRDEGLFYAKLLSENGVPTNVNVFRGVPHGFTLFGDKISASKRWGEVMADGVSWAMEIPVAGRFEIKSD
ncbi:hypothetical protein TMatcc_003272 [Talaromyces marneffei ATCC 18224]|uniref:Lipase/esterase, putative n=1 Tax=Talaromyces marneffei (strain ATCC 18224 / CBS 334.59 / QM 7333) TaxID=441960 RepID=B6Q579_TALMQ|nr:uncharacterized protein EYB26_001665 [Talaromyces marneffei]EEA28398.1 lipase/esterase, putative [Talaromyces marneffei ATCC 18224]QGA14013.1 hypothetical protein EYB26_001665 [Talaromyces marneffei]